MEIYPTNGHTAERPLHIELIRSAARGTMTQKENKLLDKLLTPPPSAKDAFIIKPAAEWLQEGNYQEGGDMLFGEFWHEGELCILFADTNVGKSILAVQIG